MSLHAFLARFPKGTRMRVSFELVQEEKRASFQITFGLTHLVHVGGEAGFMRPTLREALDGIEMGFEPNSVTYAGWTFDRASLRVEQIPSSGKSTEVIALLTPLLAERFPAVRPD